MKQENKNTKEYRRKDGTLERVERYWDNGILKSTTYYSKSGIKRQTDTYRQNNGTMRERIYYRENDKRKGVETYYEDGTLESKTYYRAPEIRERHEEYRKDGTLKAKHCCRENGTTERIEYYSKNGALRRTQKVKEVKRLTTEERLKGDLDRANKRTVWLIIAIFIIPIIVYIIGVNTGKDSERRRQDEINYCRATTSTQRQFERCIRPSGPSYTPHPLYKD